MSEFRMPSLGADMEAGTLVEWMKNPGDPVQRGEAIAAIETQKGAIEIEAFESGILDEIRVRVGQRVPVGAVLAIIRTPDDLSKSQPASAPMAALPSIVQPPPPATAAPAKPVGNETSSGRITPAARRRARELGLAVTTVAPDAEGVVGLREIEAASAASSASRGLQRTPKSGLDLDAMRKAIAASMARSWREIPHYYVSSTIDMEPMLVWLERENARRSVPERLHYSALLIKATALALKAVPRLNGRYDAERFEPAVNVHLGVAIAMRGGGLVAPALFDADTLSVAEVMTRLIDLVARVRSGRLRGLEMTSPTATFSNLGEESADAVQPIIYPPQVAIVGCGRISERAWASKGLLSARRAVTVTVGGDHRISDGRTAASLLERFDALLQQPERL